MKCFFINSIKYLLAFLNLSIVRMNTPVSTHPERQVLNAHYKGHCLQVFKDDCIGDYILSGKGWDNQLPGILTKYLSETKGDVLEIGANIGASIVPIANDFKFLTFHCVEPIPDFFALLEMNCESYEVKNVQLYNFAMGAQLSESILIHSQLGTAGAVKLYDGHTHIESISVPSSTIDEEFNHLNIKMIKIDVDGFELSVLKGAHKVLLEKSPLIFMEFHVKLIHALGEDPQEHLDLLRQYGYCNITIWDNFGRKIGETNSFDELMKIANSAKYYIDILLRK